MKEAPDSILASVICDMSAIYLDPDLYIHASQAMRLLPFPIMLRSMNGQAAAALQGRHAVVKHKARSLDSVCVFFLSQMINTL